MTLPRLAFSTSAQCAPCRSDAPTIASDRGSSSGRRPPRSSLVCTELRTQGLDERGPETAATADDAHAALDPTARVCDEIAGREARVKLPAGRREAADMRVDADLSRPMPKDRLERTVDVGHLRVHDEDRGEIGRGQRPHELGERASGVMP